jgi:hypothetical protein
VGCDTISLIKFRVGPCGGGDLRRRRQGLVSAGVPAEQHPATAAARSRPEAATCRRRLSLSIRRSFCGAQSLHGGGAGDAGAGPHPQELDGSSVIHRLVGRPTISLIASGVGSAEHSLSTAAAREPPEQGPTSKTRGEFCRPPLNFVVLAHPASGRGGIPLDSGCSLPRRFPGAPGGKARGRREDAWAAGVQAGKGGAPSEENFLLTPGQGRSSPGGDFLIFRVRG